MQALVAITAAGAVVTSGTVGKHDFDVFNYVDPLIGTSNGGK